MTASDLGAYVVYDSDKFHLLSPDGQHIMAVLLDEWARQFTTKNIDYGGDENKLGVAGAFVDIHRKEGKLKRAIWDGQTLNGEQPREILLDLIGHCFLTICAIDAESTQDGSTDKENDA